MTAETDLISRQAAIDALTKHEIELPIYAPRETDVFWNDAIDCCVSEIEALPSAQPERKKGSWNVIQGNIVVCSECGMLALKSMTGCLLNRHLEPNRTNFCPTCGADMRGEKHETD